MTAAVYAHLFGLLLTLVSLGLERLMTILQLRHRDIWLFALVASITIPAVLGYLASGAATHPDWQASGYLSLTVGLLKRNAVTVWAGTFVSSEMEIWLGWLWVVSSISFVMYQAWQFRRLRRAARDWKHLHIDGMSVLLSDDVGPAAIGLLSPKIVIPRWLLATGSETLLAALAHEHEHISSRDQLFVMFGLAFLAAMPWNIALAFQFERLCVAIEVDCDRRVVGSTAMDRHAYAEALLVLWREGNAKAFVTHFPPSPSGSIKYRLALLGCGGAVRLPQ